MKIAIVRASRDTEYYFTLTSFKTHDRYEAHERMKKIFRGDVKFDCANLGRDYSATGYPHIWIKYEEI